ncbi:MAG: rRNA pseudouridine synthase [Ignavibacteria bacterium]|nr:rRNA pseudouridine synthase [Ignavibacteria bacterium]
MRPRTSSGTSKRSSNPPKDKKRQSSGNDRKSGQHAHASKSQGRYADRNTKLRKTGTCRTKKAASINGDGTRINKYLADAGIGARRAVEEYITAGMVKVNGKVVTDLSTRIQLEDFVTVKGEPVTDRRFLVYFLLNKPKDVITTASDELGRTTVLDLIRSKYRIFPVGRLDRNTTGALLITNDGELAYRLTHPKYEIKREYKVGLDKDIDLRDARNISYGIELEDGKTGPCEVFVDPKDHSIVNLILAEGKNREVRRIFESLGYEVKKLDRKRFATLSTSSLRRGEHRQLTKAEVRALRDMVGLEMAF